MKRSHWLICAVLGLFVAAAVLTAGRLWRTQHRLSVALGAVPAAPDLSRWPAPLRREVKELSASVASAADPVAPLGRLADLYCANGFAPQALSVLAGLEKLDGRNARWPYLTAEMRLRANDQAGGARYLETATRLNPSYAPAWRRLGEIRAARAEVEPARECFEKAAELEPGNAAAAFNLACFRAQHGEDDARGIISGVSKANPQVKPFHEQLALMLEAAHDAEGAARERRLAAQADQYPSTADPWVDALDAVCYDSSRMIVRAIEMRREGRYPEFEALMARVVALAPEEPANPFAWDLLSNFYLKTGKPEAARATLEKAAAEFPDEPQMAILLVRLLCTEQLPDEAARTGEAAVRRWPANAELLAALGVALRDKGDPYAGEASLRRAVALDPTLTQAFYQLATCLIAEDRRAPAHEALDRALAMRPDYPEALYAVAKMDLEAGDYAAAEPRVNRLYALSPDEPAVVQLAAAWRLVRGQAALQAGDPDGAAQHYKAGLAVAPDFAPLLREAGFLALERGQLPDAIDVLGHWVQLEPGSPDAYLAFGTALAKAGRASDASLTFGRGLELAQKAGNPELVEKFKAHLNP